MRRLALVPVALVMVVAAIMLGSTTPQSRRVPCVPAGQAGAVAAGGGWTIPIGSSYRVSAEYGWRVHPVRGGRDLHTGIDLASDAGGAAVLAASAGTVSGVTDLGGRSYGLYIDVDHGGGLRTRYAHLAAAKVQIGQAVAAGQQIGVEGASGGVTGPHLHFEVIVNQVAQDPRQAMQAHGLVFDGRPGSLVPSGDGLPAGPGVMSLGQVLANPQGVDASGSLTSQQREYARIVVAVGRELGLPPRAWAIALATALQESTLGADTTMLRPNADGDVGLFQQRALPGWYADGATTDENVAILLDTAYAARTFYLGHDVAAARPGGAGPAGYHIPGLVDVPGWESLSLWQAAAQVQRPAAAYAAYYAKHEATVAGILAGMNLSPTTSTADCPTPAPAAAGGVAGTGAGAEAARAALAQVGIPYSWGGGTAAGASAGICCSPGGQNGHQIIGFDCSGLTLYAWAQVGVKLARTAEEQQATTTPVPRDQIIAGDLLFFPGHVGIADGHGGMIHAPRPGKPVEVLPNVLTDSYYSPRLTGVGRPA